MKVEATTQRSSPTAKVTREVMRQTLVLREVSKRRRQAMRRPGQAMTETESQAHFWLQMGLKEGTCSWKGVLKVLRRQLSQSWFLLSCMATSNAASTVIPKKKAQRATLQEVNFKTFIPATIKQHEIISEMIQLRPVNHQASITPIASAKPNPSIAFTDPHFSLICNSRILRKQIKQNSSITMRVKERVPRTHASTSTITTVAVGKYTVNNPPISKSPLQAVTSHAVQTTPFPPKERHSLLRDEKSSIASTSDTRRRELHSKELLLQALSQYTKYEKTRGVVNGTKVSFMYRRSKQFSSVIGERQLLRI